MGLDVLYVNQIPQKHVNEQMNLQIWVICQCESQNRKEKSPYKKNGGICNSCPSYVSLQTKIQATNLLLHARKLQFFVIFG